LCLLSCFPATPKQWGQKSILAPSAGRAWRVPDLGDWWQFGESESTEMDKSPFNSPSPQDSSPRLSSFTQHHRPVIAVCPHPSSALHFPHLHPPANGLHLLPHTAIRYPPHLKPQDPLKDLVSLACDPSNQQPGPSWYRSLRCHHGVPHPLTAPWLHHAPSWGGGRGPPPKPT
uniref:Uncharacterized protein n=1 Tax=Melopsittacus undulatus TaxID=13146 RepID=A0A8V5GPP3_MELUD